MSNEQLDPRLRDINASTFNPRPTTLSTPVAQTLSIAPAPLQYPPLADGSPRQTFYPPHTPQSDGDNGRQGDDINDPKRPRACEACRSLKVKCEPDLNNPDGSCKRCMKANRSCIITAPTRSRKKKSDGRVAELERKIDALTAALKNPAQSGPPAMGVGNEHGDAMFMARNNNNPYQQVTNGGFASPYNSRPDPPQSNAWGGFPKTSAPPMAIAGHKRKYSERDTASDPHSNQSRQSVHGSGPQRDNATANLFSQRQQPTTHQYVDVIDRGMLDADLATKIFDRYVERLAPHMPVVVFPTGTPAAEVRKNKPTLFLAILAASCSASYPQFEKPLTKELMSIFADRIICNGEKNLELIQALQISTMWYSPPEHFEELKFYQLIHIAAVMAIDIGMGRHSKSLKNKNDASGLWRDNPWRRMPYPDPESIEARRAWLGCYFLSCNASMGLRRPNLICWAPFMDDCLKVLENSPDAAPSDKIFCQWVRSQHIAEEVGIQFSMDDPSAIVSLSDSKVQLSLKGFENDLEKWSRRLPADVQPPTLVMTKHVISLYMHEVAMHVDHNVDEFKPPFFEATIPDLRKTEALTPPYVAALSACLQSIDGIFDTFLKLDTETLQCLPINHFVRVVYAVVVLIKMYFSASSPNSEFGKVIEKDKMKLEYYLDGLVNTFGAVAANEKSRPASKFLMVLLMLKAWFIREEEKLAETERASKTLNGKEVETSSSDLPNNHTDNQQQNPQGYATNTPLHVLSDAATGNRRGAPPNPATQAGWNQQQYPNYDPALMNQNPPAFGMAMSNIDPSLEMNLGFSMGDGFEQAMGMTLGIGDFGNFFRNDAFVNGSMDLAGGAPGFNGF